MSVPFFSVIIPCYNRADKLPNCLDSVLSQTFSDYEIIIVDNGSTDKTGELINNKYKRATIKYYWQEGSGSPANPRNNGIKHAQGIWVSFLDSDDLWYPEKLKLVYEHIIAHSNIDLVCHNELLSDSLKKTSHVLWHTRKANNMYQSMLLEGNCLSPTATTVRKSFLIDNNLFFNESVDYAIVEDYDLWLRIANKGAVISFIDDVLGEYIVDGGNMIGDWERYLRNLKHLYKSHAFEHQTFEVSKDKIFSQLMTIADWQNLHRAVDEGRIITALNLFFKMLLKHPVTFPRMVADKITNRQSKRQ